MTDNEIIKALECCSEPVGINCVKCPLEKNCLDVNMCEIALDLINRQKAEIEFLEHRLKMQAEEFGKLREELKAAYASKVVNEIHIDKQFYEECKSEVLQAKSEAIKEFAERLKECRVIQTANMSGYIDDLVKEMVGDNK